jgi:hypothetical protein
MSHFELDIHQWAINLHPDDKLHLENSQIVSVRDLLIVEKHRAAVAESLFDRSAMPCDVFVLAKGEPEHSDNTKIGGMPHRPHGLSWPRSRQGERLRFIAQFNFSRSKDLFRHLPGDLLLFFAGQEWYDDYYFEWQMASCTNVLQPTSTRHQLHDFVTCYGLRYRTCDYLSPHYHADIGGLAILHAMKIGGLPCWLQGPMKAPGDFLCSLPSIKPHSGVPWPWSNVEPPISEEEADAPANTLLWLDMGMLYFYLDENGEVTMLFQSG